MDDGWELDFNVIPMKRAHTGKDWPVKLEFA
jgi:hypothetical protein